jgi:helicase
MLDTIRDGYRAAYVAPLKAIIEEKIRDWSQKYPEFCIGLFTGDVDRTRSVVPRGEHILLFTPEKLNAYLQSWKSNLTWISRLGVLVIDEFHFLGDPGRGSNLETLISRVQRVNPFIRFIGLSATLSNAEELAKWLKARIFTSDWRPVALEKRSAPQEFWDSSKTC